MANLIDTNAVRKTLVSYAKQATTIDYKSLCQQLGIEPPQSIQKVTALLEACQEDDANLGLPQLAAVVISKGANPIPRPGFFQTLTQLDLYHGSDEGAQAQMWHQNELEKVFEFYSDNEQPD
ncbi:hypothetical protein [Reinekea thalattae]|uniref:Uncharacterized protein n=1 Tax=Reinekea thalattae TaxID=2593301 RepID=A0A5C8Z8X1_9GAMM|nr:hypothetical protein [Reinekea thalattae]TXR53601.1 hypothetical protein FME95_03285 [Reinekea thalattae]